LGIAKGILRELWRFLFAMLKQWAGYIFQAVGIVAAYEVFRIALTRKVRGYNITCLRNADGTGWGREDAFQLANLSWTT